MITRTTKKNKINTSYLINSVNVLQNEGVSQRSRTGTSLSKAVESYTQDTLFVGVLRGIIWCILSPTDSVVDNSRELQWIKFKNTRIWKIKKGKLFSNNFFSKYILIRLAIGLISRDRGSIPGRGIPKTKKMVKMPPCFVLSIVRIKVKRSNPGNGVAPSPTSRCSR